MRDERSFSRAGLGAPTAGRAFGGHPRPGPGDLRYVSGSLAAGEALACLCRVRVLLERSGAEVTSASGTALTFRSPLSPSNDGEFPCRDEFGPAPAWESTVVVDAPGTPAAAIRFAVSTGDAYYLALFWFVFLVPLFVVSPLLAAGAGSPLPLIGVAAGLAAAVANGLSFRRSRERTEAAFRRLLEASLDAAAPPCPLPAPCSGARPDHPIRSHRRDDPIRRAS